MPLRQLPSPPQVLKVSRHFKNKYPGDSSCDPFITECCCRAQLRKAGQRKSTCCKGNGGENPGALGRSTLLAALLCCSSSLLATDRLDQAWMFKNCHEGSSHITAGRQNIKQKTTTTTEKIYRSQQWTERPHEHCCTKQADKTAPVKVNAFGKIYFDNKNLRYLYPEQGTGRAKKEKCHGRKQSTYSRHTKPSAPAHRRSGPGRQHHAKADGIHINIYQFSLCIC